jgi:hypothetical protein
MKITDISGIKIGDKVAIMIHNDKEKSTSVTGVLSGIQVLPSDSVGLCIHGLTQWIWLEKNMTVTWSGN